MFLAAFILFYMCGRLYCRYSARCLDELILWTASQRAVGRSVPKLPNLGPTALHPVVPWGFIKQMLKIRNFNLQLSLGWILLFCH